MLILDSLQDKGESETMQRHVTSISSLTGCFQGGFELDKEAAIFDNHINEARLAHVCNRKLSDEILNSTSRTQQIINSLTELAINGQSNKSNNKTLEQQLYSLYSGTFENLCLIFHYRGR